MTHSIHKRSLPLESRSRHHQHTPITLDSKRMQIARMKKIVDRISPDRIQLNTAVRPTADAAAKIEPRVLSRVVGLGPGQPPNQIRQRLLDGLIEGAHVRTPG